MDRERGGNGGDAVRAVPWAAGGHGLGLGGDLAHGDAAASEHVGGVGGELDGCAGNGWGALVSAMVESLRHQLGGARH